MGVGEEIKVASTIIISLLIRTVRRYGWWVVIATGVQVDNSNRHGHSIFHIIQEVISHGIGTVGARKQRR